MDDDRLFIEALAAFVASDDRLVVVGTAENGKRGVDLASALRPDVVLMDIDMPIMDGVEASRLIHREQPHLPIVLVSASQFVDRVEQAREAGAVGYVQKACVEADLVKTILAAAEGGPEAAELLRASLAAKRA